MYLFTGSSSEDPAMSVRYLYKVLGISARKCLDWHLYDLMLFNFVNNIVFLALVALYLPRVFLCKAMLDVDVGTFLVWGNKPCCHWHKALLVWAGLGSQAGGRAQGQRGLGGCEWAPACKSHSVPSVCAQAPRWLEPAFLWAGREWEFSVGRKPRHWSRFLKVPARISV